MTRADYLEELKSMADYELIELWNDYDYDHEVHLMQEFTDYNSSKTFCEVAIIVDGDDFNFGDDYWYFGDDCKVRSTSDIYSIINVEELADYLVESNSLPF